MQLGKRGGHQEVSVLHLSTGVRTSRSFGFTSDSDLVYIGMTFKGVSGGSLYLATNQADIRSKGFVSELQQPNVIDSFTHFEDMKAEYGAKLIETVFYDYALTAEEIEASINRGPSSLQQTASSKISSDESDFALVIGSVMIITLTLATATVLRLYKRRATRNRSLSYPQNVKPEARKKGEKLHYLEI